jgi:hypothetical protein
MSVHILLCGEVPLYFIFVNRNNLRFKFELNSNEFVNYKVFWIVENIFFSLLDFGPKPLIHLEPA